VYIAAGGIGVAPMVFLGSFLEKKGIKKDNMILYLGGRSQTDLLCKEEFHRQGITVTITTDDGSEGEACLLTDPLENAVRKQRPDIIYACGPKGMLKCVAGIATTYGVACQLSIETLMACGVGACLGCAVASQKNSSQYLHACLDGPIFDVDALALNSL
jgi:dihydroorotate dehydrogenase electron transfer subunit